MVKRKGKASRSKKAARKKKSSRPKKAMRATKAARPKKTARAKKPARRTRPTPGTDALSLPERRGLGPDAGGQSGDIEGLHGVATADSESVEELAEEGQSFEAEVIDAVEGARDPDQGELKTREVPEDDVPSEYDDQ
jgi:hypothetical protein